MGDLARPMLAEVLACVEGITDPAEAQETLVARGLLPEGWCDVARRGWHDRRLRSIEAGRLQGYDAACPSLYVVVVRVGDTRGRLQGYDAACPSPRTTPDLVAVASLGWPAIQRAEELAREACAALREYGCPQPERVVWRVSERSDDRNLFAWRGAGGALRVVEGAKDRRIGPVSLWPDGVCEPARELWLSGLAIDAITADAVRIVVPPVGGGRG